MKINRKKLNRTISLVLLTMLDICIIGLIAILYRDVNKIPWQQMLFFIFGILGISPFIICEHFENIPKHIEDKLFDVIGLGFSIPLVCVIAYEALATIRINMFVGVVELVISILLAFAGILVMIRVGLKAEVKIPSEEQI